MPGLYGPFGRVGGPCWYPSRRVSHLPDAAGSVVGATADEAVVLSPDPPLIFVWWVKITILVCGGVCWDVGMREPPVLRLLRGPGGWVGGVMWSAAQGDGGDAVQCGGDRLRPGPGGR